MPVVSAADLVAALRQLRLLPPEQLDAVAREIEGQTIDARALAGKLIQDGRLTPFQANQLLQERGSELLLGSYILLERLGEGGMGAVFKARHQRLGRVAAIKIIRKDRLENPDAVKRFQREVRAAAQLSHPNIVMAYDADEAGGAHFMAMECIDGIDLAKLVKEKGPLPIAAACDYIRQAALGLQHAFERGMVHRDIKPANLLLVPRRDGGGTVKILDMGLARLAASVDGAESSTLTQEGAVMGTPDYIAPEQVMGAHDVDIRADLYSLGCTFYFLLTGRVPFPGGTLGAKLVQHQLQQPMPVEQRRSDVPPGVAAVVRKLMAKRRSDRFQTPAELAAVLAGGVPSQTAAEAGRIPAITAADPIRAGRGVDVAVPPAVAVALATGAPVADTLATPDTARSPRRPARRRPRLAWAIAGGVALVTGLLALLLLFALRPGAPPASGQPVKGPANPPTGLEKVITNSLGMKLVLIPPGKFMMGSPKDEAGRSDDEGPQHEVEITRPFYLGAYPVTQEEYEKATGKNPSFFRNGGDKAKFPVESVSWEDAVAFCEAMNGQDSKRPAGWKYSLPTEAEWEYACRAATKTAYSFGDDSGELGDYAWFIANCGRPNPVGTKRANPWGLYDMHGNVYQWCADGYGKYPEGPQKDPKGFEKAETRVFRGGSWSNQFWFCRSAQREAAAPAARLHIVGIRLCMIQDS